jgi:hypothetical protein
MILPEFTEGVHYRQLRGGKYRFELLRDVAVCLPQLAGHAAHLSCRDAMRREWVRIERARYTIRAGYRWNGASPKKWVGIGTFGFWVGTPDPIDSRLGSCWHDTAFQFLRVADFPIVFAAANEIFRDILRASGFRRAETWHGAVQDFGKHFVSEFPERGEHSVILAP